MASLRSANALGGRRTSLRVVAVVGAATGLLLAGATTVAAAASAGVSITSIRPAAGPVGSTLTINGSGFAVGDTVTIGSSSPASPVALASTNTMTVTVPSDATTGHVTVADGTGASATSAQVFVVQRGTQAAITSSATAVTYPHHVVLTGRLLQSGVPVAGPGAVLQSRSIHGDSWHRVPGTHTRYANDNGRASWRLSPKATRSYRVSFGAGRGTAAANSAPTIVTVRPHLQLQPGAAAYFLHPTALHGTIAPHLAGRIALQRHSHGHWRTIAHATAHHGRFAMTVTPKAAGVEKLRLVRPADAGHGQAVSKPRRVAIVGRELAYGAQGADVKALQRRLKALHYDVGKITGSYGWDTVHAVTAFEKVQGLSRDGRTGAAVWKALGHPQRAHLRHPLKHAAGVEVNLNKQVLLYAVNGKIKRIVDTSTGGGYTYTNPQSGVQATAVTPMGHFHVTYKVNHLEVVPLGTMYRPAYFNYSGDAIHGEGETNSSSDVPPHPVSHGCVRIPNSSQDRLYKKLTIGLSVWIYR